MIRWGVTVALLSTVLGVAGCDAGSADDGRPLIVATTRPGSDLDALPE